MVILRLLRLLRVLKLLKAFPELQVIVSALIAGMGSIGYIGVILILVFYVFGILGMILFQDNDPWHFGTLWDAMFSLFRAATLEDWTNIMYTQTEGCANYGAFVMCEPWQNCTARIEDPNDLEAFNELFCCCPGKSAASPTAGYIYWVMFTILGAQVLLTLFIGVITTSMEEAQEQQKQERMNEADVKEAALSMGLSDKAVEHYRYVFDLLDTDKSGGIDEDELKSGLAQIGFTDITEEKLAEMYLLMENDDEDDISYVQFMKLMCKLKKKDLEEKATGLSEEVLVPDQPPSGGGDGTSASGELEMVAVEK